MWVALKKAVGGRKPYNAQFTWLSGSSWGEVQPGCWAVHLPGRWWHRIEACSTPRRYGWRAEDDGGWSWTSCCHGRRYLPTREPQRPSTPWRQPCTLGHRHLHARSSFHGGEDDGFFPLGTEVQHGWICSFPWHEPFLPFHVQTWFKIVENFGRQASRKIRDPLLVHLCEIVAITEGCGQTVQIYPKIYTNLAGSPCISIIGNVCMYVYEKKWFRIEKCM